MPALCRLDGTAAQSVLIRASVESRSGLGEVAQQLGQV